MKADIDKYITICPTCKRNKTTRHKCYGMSHMLETPDGPETDRAMDFITSLLRSGGLTQMGKYHYRKQSVLSKWKVNDKV